MKTDLLPRYIKSYKSIREKRIMRNTEIEILMRIYRNKHYYNRVASSRMAITHPYLSYAIDSLVRRGYLEGNKKDGYKLTLRGEQAVIDYFKLRKEEISITTISRIIDNHETKIRDEISKLNALGSKCNEELDDISNLKSN